MATPRTRGYNPQKVRLTVGGFVVEGFSNGSSITAEPVQENAAEYEYSLDGRTVMVSQNVEAGYIITFSVQPSSRSYKRLTTQQKTQQDSEAGVIDDLAVRLYDPMNGDSLSDSQGYFLTRPKLGRGTKPDGVEFKILLPSPASTFGAEL